MSERPARRGLLRCTALVTAAVLAFGGTSTALAQEDPTSTSPTPTPTETVTPPPTETVTPPSSEQPTPPSPSDPATPAEPTHENPPQSPDPSTPVPPVAPPATTVEPPKPEEQKPEAKQEKQAEQAAPDLKLSLAFDKPEFAMGEAISLTVKITNAGDAPANQIRFAAEPGGMYLTTGVDELISRPTLAPGESRTFKVGATAESQSGDRLALSLRAYVEGATDKAPNDNAAQAEAKLTQNSGRLSGVVYEDKNGNGVADPGENLPGYQQLKLTGGSDFPGSTLQLSNGQFSTWAIPAGKYQARLSGGYFPDGQRAIKPGQFFVVNKGESTEVALQAVPALYRSLEKVGASFDKPKYAKGDPISVSFTLKNSGTAPITGLVTVCDPENDPATLDGTGEGWGELRPSRGGVTIGAGETKTFTVTDTVPDVDYPTGKVYFACVFSVDGRNVDGRIGNPNSYDPGLTIGADVARTIGQVSGRVLRDGQPVTEPVKVVAYNASNNRIVGDDDSNDWNGEWSIPNVAQGKIALKVVGRWKFADGSTTRLVDVVGDQDAKVDLEVVPGDEVKDPTVYSPDLKVSVTFDKQAYDISDPVLMTLKVENIGTGKSPARGSWLSTYTEDQPYFDSLQLNKFTQSGIELWPGESKQITLVGKARDGGSDPEKLRKMRYVTEVGGPFEDPDKTNNKAEARADVVWSAGNFTAVVYGDGNLNGKMDAGEALGGLTVQVGGGKPWVNMNAKSDGGGRVRFTGVPAGGYRAWVNWDREGGWVAGGSNTDGPQTGVVNPGDEGSALVRMVRPLSDKLKTSLKYDQPSYPAGAKVGLTASITNETGSPIQVKADCGTSSGFGPYLGNEGAGWGPLARDAAGVEIAAGATFTQHVVDATMPEQSPSFGYVETYCTFGPENGAGNPFVSARTKVPGATETFKGAVVKDFMNPTKVPNVKLVLLDPETGRTVASTTTDAEGKWVFPDLPVGDYTPLVLGPWRTINTWEEGQPFGNVRGADYESWIFVEPGPDVADPGSTSYKITTGHDKNDDGRIELGEEISGLKISLRDKTTGGLVAERTTGADGKVEFVGVPAGRYWARVDGSWMFKGGFGAWDVIIGGPGRESTFYLVPGVAAAEMRGLIRFEKASYESHEKVRFWLTVTNIGGKPAEKVRLDWGIHAVDLPQDVWGDFSYGGAGIQLAPGESRTFEGFGNIRDIHDGKLSIHSGIEYQGRPNPHQSGISGEVPVVQTKGDLSGVVYTDKNRNGQQDSGEAAAGALVEIYGGVPSNGYKATTDAEGRYSFKGTPSGDYWVNYTLADGWIVHNENGAGDEVRVQPGAPVQLTARAERPFSESLSATLTLDKDTYQVGEVATVTITLKNSSDRAISGIQAGCNRIGDEDQLGGTPRNGVPEGWGDLFGKGVTVGAGETKTIIVTEKVPQASYTTGTVTAACDFEPQAGYNTDGPFAQDVARVPGGFGSLEGELYHDRNGNGTPDAGETIGNTRIVLHDRVLGADAAETVSDAQGHVRFDRLPAGEYMARVDGPWKFEGEYGGYAQVAADRQNRNDFVVVPADQPQPPAGGGGSTPPASAGGDALAKTGASVLGLGLVGALLVAFGFGAAAVGRRRVA
ncbi:hypothetical protein UK23_08110 [Lentzea aerocolonigenes]|uniref:SD-repeat containing protein B domain-containing protein n=1 Tax=Lentzea aerocolonigenes TaxID=68170 RepID=A0A0F0HC15_LENAE|nr:SdrD B-like domain-containing protein [Lentzea aerocolonigenes]KJK51178.1 hypothetical protein UK23_08110 [Lentzea aerocolonigenes]